MKLLISGDPHGKANNLKIFKEYLDCLLEIQKQECRKIDKVVILGDLFNSHAVIRSEVLNVWADYLSKITKEHILLVGNHDETSPGSGVHALAPFRNTHMVEVVDEFPLKLCTKESRDLYFIAFKNDIDEFCHKLNGGYRPKNKEGILFCHQTFEGAQFENGFYAPGGFPMEHVADYQLVVCGDIHKEQQVGNIWYSGTPYQMNFNDAGEQKGVWVFDTETLEREKIGLGLPQYYIKECKTLDEIEDYFLGADLKGKYKIILIASRNEVRAIQDSKEFKELKKKYQITLSPRYVDVRDTEVKIQDSISPEKMMEEYVNKIMKTDLDRELLLDKSLEILKGVQS